MGARLLKSECSFLCGLISSSEIGLALSRIDASGDAKPGTQALATEGEMNLKWD